MTEDIKEVSQTEFDQEQDAPIHEPNQQATDSQALGSQLKEAADDQEVAELKSLEDSAASSSIGAMSGGELDMESLMDVPVTLSVEIGRKKMPINQLVNLSPGAIVDLNRDLDAPLDLLVNGTLIARGEVVVMGKKFGLRLVDICSPNDRVRGLSQ